MKKRFRSLLTVLTAGLLLPSLVPAASGQVISANPTVFTDVPVQHADQMKQLYEKQWFSGVSAAQFGWNDSISRADAAVILFKALELRPESRVPVRMNPESGLLEPHKLFTDVPARAAAPANRLQEEGVMKGKSDGVFGARDAITRGEFALIVSRAFSHVLKPADQSAHTFTDAGGRYAEAVSQLQASGVTQGKAATFFGTQDSVTRGEFALLLARLMELVPEKNDIKGEAPSGKNGITMTLDKQVYSLQRDYEFQLTIQHKGAFIYSTHPSFVIEKKQGETWQRLAVIVSSPGVLVSLYPEGIIKDTWHYKYFKDPLTPGEYRAIQHFSRHNHASFWLAVPFTIIP